jgi:NTP pyrophosphatase (non-canonical NTP hydrolase)
MTQIQNLIQDLFVHLAARGWDKPNPASLAKSIIIEAAELLEHFQWSEPDLNTIKNDKIKQQKIQEELADVMIYCLELAKILDVDPEAIIRQKIESSALKYPADLVKNNNETYWQLKRKARENNLEN